MTENGKLVPKKPHHKKLDVKSVDIHELQHVDDIMENLTKAQRKTRELTRCSQSDVHAQKSRPCKKALTNTVQNRIKTILKIAYEGILNHQHSTETARKAQAKYLIESCKKKKLKLEKRVQKKKASKKSEVRRRK